MTPTLGQLVQSFFVDHLAVQKGLRPGSIRSYRDTLRLFLCFVSEQMHKPIARLSLQDLTFDRVLCFLKYLEQDRGNHARTRNQRRAALNTFFAYLALRVPEMLATCQQVAAIPVKRTPPPATHYLEQTEVNALLHHIPRRGRHAIRDRTLLLFLYNTGARVQEAADVRVEHLDLDPPAKVHLHGKGDKWRVCPLWNETVNHLKQLLAERGAALLPSESVFCSRRNVALTRHGIYKIVRRHGASWDTTGAEPRRVTPHLFRHTAAVLLLESGVEVNVIRGWLGHVSLDTTNRYAELTLRAKAAALRACEPACATSAGGRSGAVWKNDKTLLDWLHAL
jgi:site-specific recombinase XerD